MRKPLFSHPLVPGEEPPSGIGTMEGSSLLGIGMEWVVDGDGDDSVESLAYIRIPSDVCVEFDDGFCATAILRLFSKWLSSSLFGAIAASLSTDTKGKSRRFTRSISQ